MGNQKNYDSEFCGKVPLHQTNLIQPHGVLMILQKEDLTIVQVSENVQDLLGVPATRVACTSLKHYITEEQAHTLQARFEGNTSGKIPFTFTFSEVAGSYLALVQAQNDYLLVEIEIKALDGEQNSFISVYQELKYVISAIEDAVSIEEGCQTVVNELKRISGFDKIMIYRFDEDWNGTVIAERMEEGMDAYLGLKFPASDIPRQAREMYRKNPYRLIPNANYQPVRLYPVINPAVQSFTDLSDTHLRSVAAVHLEYLHNMNVVASMSTRIVKDGRLWGLISCHHRSPKYLSYQMCALFELLSNIISAKITALEQQEAFSLKTHTSQLYTQVVESVYKSSSLLDGLNSQQENLLQLLKADGIAVVLNNEVQTYGITPATAEVEDLVFWLQTKEVYKAYQQTSLSETFEDAESYAPEASGILALPIQPDKGNYIVGFRPEAVRKVFWGGNPNEAIHFEPDGKAYHPRNSFKLWQETVQRNAIPWSREEMETAENFRNFVVEYTLNKM